MRCPNCESTTVARDSSNPWIYLIAVFFFPFGLIAFFFNKNAWCMRCGVRFKRLD